MHNPALVAERNMLALGENPYPGRGIVIGTDKTGKYMVQVYWIEGRSPNSRNRVLTEKDGAVFTEAADPAKMKDPKLIIYNAMRERGPRYVVSNGDQTDTVIQGIRSRYNLMDTMMEREYEPDEPNFTPRITGLCSLDSLDPRFQLAILRRSPWGTCERHFFTYEQVAAGFGYCIHTYMGDSDPLLSWHGEPLLMPLKGGIEEIAASYWDKLDEANRVSLAVKFIHMELGVSDTNIVNKYTKV